MSPHNHARFNGSNIHSPSSYHTGQNQLAIAFGNGVSYIGRFVYTYSGLKLFYTRRFFKRGIKDITLNFSNVEKEYYEPLM